MAVEIKETSIYQVGATTDDGKRLILSNTHLKKGAYYSVTEMNGRIGIMSLFETLSKVCNSGTDMTVIGKLIEQANESNQITVLNMTAYAEQVGISRETLKRLLKRAVDEGLFHKLTTGQYMVNPYIIMSKGLTSSKYELQELAQTNWRKLTGLLTSQQLAKLVKLAKFLELDTALYPNEFNLSVAEYFATKGEITDKQRDAILNKKQ